MNVAYVDLPSTVRRCAQREASDDTAGPFQMPGVFRLGTTDKGGVERGGY